MTPLTKIGQRQIVLVGRVHWPCTDLAWHRGGLGSVVDQRLQHVDRPIESPALDFGPRQHLLHDWPLGTVRIIRAEPVGQTPHAVTPAVFPGQLDHRLQAVIGPVAPRPLLQHAFTEWFDPGSLPGTAIGVRGGKRHRRCQFVRGKTLCGFVQRRGRVAKVAASQLTHAQPVLGMRHQFAARKSFDMGSQSLHRLHELAAVILEDGQPQQGIVAQCRLRPLLAKKPIEPHRGFVISQRLQGSRQAVTALAGQRSVRKPFEPFSERLLRRFGILECQSDFTQIG